MTDEQIALARRAVACKGWRWMRGMSNDRGQTIDCVFEEIGTVYCGEIYADMHALPDLTDPATLGCLLALVREAHAVQFLQVSVKISREHGYQFDCHPHHRGQWVDSEAEALVAALEAAPCGR